MPPKRKKTPMDQRFRCDQMEGERFHAQTDDVFRYNWWEVFCFPYILCARFWDCCVSLCAGTNQCMVYWMVIQWIVCKITRLTTPNAIIFPYYFYMFCQVILLTIFFILLWNWIGTSVVIPYFVAFYNALAEAAADEPSKNATRLSFRRTKLFRTTSPKIKGTTHHHTNIKNTTARHSHLNVAPKPTTEGAPSH